MNQAADIPVEATLREELAHGDSVLGTIAPILGHLVQSPDNSLFSDEIIAQIRGMASHVAAQIIFAQAEQAAEDNLQQYVDRHSYDLVGHLLTNADFLSHCHSLAIERHLARCLEERSGIDLVLSPLLGALVASDDSAVSSNAMAVLTAQARFIEQQGRMELPLRELPGDLFHAVVLEWRSHAGEGTDEITERAEQKLRFEYDEGAGRLGLIARLVSGMGNGALAALSINHAGVAIFLTALASGSQQDRHVAVLSTNDRQLGRLALSLRAAGLKPKEVEEQFVHIHPDIALPEGFDMLRSDRAAEILAASGGLAAG